MHACEDSRLKIKACAKTYYDNRCTNALLQLSMRMRIVPVKAWANIVCLHGELHKVRLHKVIGTRSHMPCHERTRTKAMEYVFPFLSEQLNAAVQLANQHEYKLTGKSALFLIIVGMSWGSLRLIIY